MNLTADYLSSLNQSRFSEANVNFGNVGLEGTEMSEEEENKAKQIFQKIKEMGPAGIISYGIVQVIFQGLSFCICAYVFYQTTGHWPDFSDPEDAATFGGGAIAFVNVARLAAPLRMMLALGGASWIQNNVMNKKNNEA